MSEAALRTPRQSVSKRAESRDARRRQLIDATICAISRYGLSKTTLAQVGKIAGQSASIVNFYFKSKEQLLLVTLDFLASEYSREMTKTVAAAANPAAAVSAVIALNFSEKICTEDKVAVWYAFTAESRARRDYLRICEEKDSEGSRLLERQFVTLCDLAGKPARQARILATGLEGLIQNYWQELLFRPATFDRRAAAADCLAYMRDLFPAQFGETAVNEQQPAANGAEKSDLLPVWTYQNREFFDLEINTLFRPNWLLTGHIGDIPDAGDYYTFDCFGERVLIVRDKRRQVRAFHNVCRHRGARLVQGERGNCPHRLTCPFHGWSYELDGRLKMVPLSKTFPDLDKATIRLQTIECEIWHGFIFIRFIPGGASIGEQLQPLEKLVAPYQAAAMRSLKSPRSETRPYNWKIIHDIDNEGYHVPVGHPGLQSLYGGNYEDFEQDGFPISVGRLRPPDKNDTWSAAHYKKILPEFSHLSDKERQCWLYIGIFPNLVLAFYPDMMEFYMTLPQTPAQTRYYFGSYALADDRRAVMLARYLNQRINKETEEEDESFVAWMQEGLNSSAFPQFKLSSIEQGVRDFHKRIQSLLPVGEMLHPPAAGTVAEVNRRLSDGRIFQ